MRSVMKRLNKASLNQGLVISANKQFGKSNSLQILMSHQPRDTVDVIVDYASQHCFKLKFQVVFMKEDYLLKPHFAIHNDIILDFSQTTKKVAGQIIRVMVKEEFMRRVQDVISLFKKGEPRIIKRPWFRFWFEESQDLIGRYLGEDDDLKTVMCVGANYKMSFGFITQRLADLNAKLVERSAFLVGRQTGDNNLRKLSSTFGVPRKKLRFIESLKVGEFVFYNGERLEKIQFPLFEGKGRAYELGSRVIRKKIRLGRLSI